MSDEDIYRKIGELEKHIAELRGKLPTPQDEDWKGPVLPPGKPLQAQEVGDPFRIHSEAELQLNNLPDLAQLIFDALPVQIYIKKPRIDDPVLGRQYIYLNQKAREIKGWKRGEEKGKHDRQIFADNPKGEELFKKMVPQETKTIEEGNSRFTDTEWNMDSGSWKRNRNVEIPILDQKGQSIGFCSISNSILFERLPAVLHFNQRSSGHTLANLATEVRSYLNMARTILTGLSKQTFTLQPNINTALHSLAAIGDILELSIQTSDIQLRALESIGGPITTGTIANVIEELQSAYEGCGFTLTITPSAGLNAAANIQQPNAVKAILSVLISNAIKHRDRKVLFVADVRCNIGVRATGNQVVWVVENDCEKYEAVFQLNELDVDGRLRGGFDSDLLRGIVAFAFPGKLPEDLIRREKPSETEFRATLVTEVVPNA
jgi:PAS domain-containing protein